MTYKTEAERRMEAPSAGELAFEAAVDKAYNERWWEEDHDYVVLTASYMAEHEGEYTIKDVASLVEKPWKWTDAYVKAQEWVAEDGIGAYIDTTPPQNDCGHTFATPGQRCPHCGAETPYVDEDIARGDR